MKRFFLTYLLIFTSTLAFADKLTIKNTVGADLDEVGDYDLYAKSTTTDVSGSEVSDSTFAFGEQFQLDWESYTLNGRFRLEMLYSNAQVYDDDDNELPEMLFIPSGFLHYTPILQCGIVAGNDFYKHFAIPSAYLAAEDTTTKWGRLITDSLGHDEYFTSGNVGLYSNGFAGGITSDWSWGEDYFCYVKSAVGATIYPDSDEFEKALDAGVNGGILNLFDLGFTAHNMTEEDRKFGAFAGYTGVSDLVLNVGFYYNFTDSDFLPESRVTRSDDNNEDYYEYKKQKTKYALGLSTGYKFSNGFGIYGDIISGLTNEYIGTIKYYANDGTLIKTVTTTIIRGETCVKYKYNSSGVLKAKRTDEFAAETIPFYSQIRFTYDFTTDVEGACNIKMRTLLFDDSGESNWLTFYPRLSVKLPEKKGTVAAGLRFDFNKARYDGLSSVSLPITYTYKFKKKF